MMDGQPKSNIAPTFSKRGYNKCSEISNTFLFLFSNEMLVIRAGTHKIHVRKANREDHDQTASKAV